MTAQIKQAMASTTRAGGGTLTYWIKGTQDGTEARDLLLATAPATYNFAPLADYAIDQLDDAWDILTARAEYRIPSVTQPEEESGNIHTSFDAMGGTIHITQSLETRGAYCAPCANSRPGKYLWNGTSYSTVGGETAYLPSSDNCTEVAPTYAGSASSVLSPIVGDIKYGQLVPPVGPLPKPPYTGGAIGITKDGVEGVDIEGGPFNFTKRVYLDFITDDQVARLARMKDHVNSVPWGPFNAGEVRFRGMTGASQGRANVELSLSFVAEGNRTGITIGQISGIRKLGHEYLWVYYQEFADPVSNVITKRPIYCYVERVYHWDNFETIDEILDSAVSQAWED